jgi:hypothetical protein
MSWSINISYVGDAPDTHIIVKDDHIELSM